MMNIKLDNKELEMVLLALSKMDKMKERKQYVTLYNKILNKESLTKQDWDLVLHSLSKMDRRNERLQYVELYNNIIAKMFLHDIDKEYRRIKRLNKKENCILK